MVSSSPGPGLPGVEPACGVRAPQCPRLGFVKVDEVVLSEILKVRLVYVGA